jgi:hypothetical protein
MFIAVTSMGAGGSSPPPVDISRRAPRPRYTAIARMPAAAPKTIPPILTISVS